MLNTGAMFRLVMFCLVLCDYINSVPSLNTTKNTLRIGFLASFQKGPGKIIAGAIPQAIQNINRYRLHNQFAFDLKFKYLF